MWSTLRDKTERIQLISSFRHQVPNYHVENARAIHKTLKGIKINKNSFEVILTTLTVSVLSKIIEIIVKSYSLIVC
jgi:hypothetical protein